MDTMRQDNISSKELFDSLELMIMTNPDSDGIRLEDSEGRVWYIELTDVRYLHSRELH